MGANSQGKKKKKPYQFAKVPCFLTGKLVLDTDRERIKQKLAKFLVDERGFSIDELIPDQEYFMEFKGKKIVSIIDLLIKIDDRILLLARCNPGSVVTRETCAISLARLFLPEHIIPYAIQANLDDVAILDVRNKKAIEYGWENIPLRSELLEMTKNWPPPALPENRIGIEQQLLFSYETHWRKDPPELRGDVLVYK